MPAPTDVEGIRRICGMAQYMSRFIPDLAGTLEPIRALTRRDVPFVWSKECENAFDTLKRNLSESACLAYYDPSKELVIQVDSSKHGLGAALLQDGRPIEYASRALTPSERNWVQIEKEALAVLYGLERFDQYTYGQPITVENDHKPLASIISKPLSMAPKRLQDIMMRYNRYDVNFVFTKGSKEEKHFVSPCACPYFDIRDTLTVVDGILLKGEAVIIPTALRASIKKRLHSSHLGCESMLRRARNSVFWPHMPSDIRQMADTCEICQQMKPKNVQEPLKQHVDGDEPWQKVGLDIFQIADKHYLVTVYYYSNFIEVDLLTTLTSGNTIHLLKKHFSR